MVPLYGVGDHDSVARRRLFRHLGRGVGGRERELDGSRNRPPAPRRIPKGSRLRRSRGDGTAAPGTRRCPPSLAVSLIERCEGRGRRYISGKRREPRARRPADAAEAGPRGCSWGQAPVSVVREHHTDGAQVPAKTPREVGKRLFARAGHAGCASTRRLHPFSARHRLRAMPPFTRGRDDPARRTRGSTSGNSASL